MKFDCVSQIYSTSVKRANSFLFLEREKLTFLNKKPQYKFKLTESANGFYLDWQELNLFKTDFNIYVMVFLDTYTVLVPC